MQHCAMGWEWGAGTEASQKSPPIHTCPENEKSCVSAVGPSMKKGSLFHKPSAPVKHMFRLSAKNQNTGELAYHFRRQNLKGMGFARREWGREITLSPEI